MIPSRNTVRHWLVNHSRNEILQELAKIKAEHGDDAEQEVKDLLNLEREMPEIHEQIQKRLLKEKIIKAIKPYVEQTPAEKSLALEHEKRKRQMAQDIQSQRKLYGDE